VETNEPTYWIVTTTFNDHQSTLKLLREISNLETQLKFKVVVVDDCSSLLESDFIELSNFSTSGTISEFNFHRLRQNLGNQGAVAKGLRFAFDKSTVGDYFIVMDSDGEDSPKDILKLIEFSGKNELVVAQRAKQKSNINLRLWHILFKITLKFLTGKKLDFGNFSLVSYNTASILLSNSSIAISYVGCLLKSNIVITRVKLKRGKRFHGVSKTGKDGLLVWGFLIMSVFSDRIFAKLLRVGVVFGGICSLGVLVVLYMRLFTNLAIPGWSGLMVAVLASSIVQTLILLSGFIMLQSLISAKRISG
jgi:glycosyltransferase involved in cell wall biosynthesis